MVAAFLKGQFEEALGPFTVSEELATTEGLSLAQSPESWACEEIDGTGCTEPQTAEETERGFFVSADKRLRNLTLRHIEEELEALELESTADAGGFRCCRPSAACLTPGGPRSRIDTPCTNGFFAGVIMLNAIFIGIETDYRSRTDEHWSIWFLVESLFLVIFAAEVLLRIRSLGCQSARRDNWNAFDVAIVVLGALDSWVLQFAVSDSTGQTILWLRLVRLLRVLRIVRLFRFFSELRVLAQGILGALRAMAWAGLLIVVALYLSAVLTTNLIGRHNGGVKRGGDIGAWFGSIGSSVFTLFQLMTLEDWPEIVRNVMIDVPLAWVFFVPFIMFMNFAMLNVITAVVVEKVFAVARSEAASEARIEERKRICMLRKIKQLFESIDKHGNAELDLEEFREALKSPAVVQQFMELGIAKYDADDLFSCLDCDGDSKLSVAEFVEGCLRVHGPAQSKHLLQVQYDMLRNWEALWLELEDLRWYVRWVIRHLSYRYQWRAPGAPTGRAEERAAAEAPKSSQSLSGRALAAGGDAIAGSSAPGGRADAAGSEPLLVVEAEAKAAVEELQGIQREQRVLRSTVEGLLAEVRCIREELPADPVAPGDEEAG